MIIKVRDKASLGEDTPLEALYDIGEVDVFDKTTPDELVSRCSDADVIVLNKIKITGEVIRSSPKLKLICVFATGYDNIDIATARECGVAVCNVPGYSTDSVALFTMATVLSLCANLSEYNEYVKSGNYTKSGVPNKLTPVYHEIRGKTWGIVGYGNIGRAVGKIAEAMGARVIVNKRTLDPDCECVDIDTLCRESDIITLHCPLNNETREIINKDRIALMKSNVILVNEARGAVVNESDVTEAIESGRIAAFGCDVYSVEPFRENHPYQRIKSNKNVLLTPHAAWGAYEARARCIDIIAKNIKSFIRGETLNRVDI
jgi:glycerate dehydrogenase